jgi:hypothetical protein
VDANSETFDEASRPREQILNSWKTFPAPWESRLRLQKRCRNGRSRHHYPSLSLACVQYAFRHFTTVMHHLDSLSRHISKICACMHPSIEELLTAVFFTGTDAFSLPGLQCDAEAPPHHADSVLLCAWPIAQYCASLWVLCNDCAAASNF